MSYILNSNLDHVTEYKFKILVNNPKDMLQNLNEVISKYEIDITKIKITDDDEDSENEYILYECKAFNSNFNKNQFIAELAKQDKVNQVIEV